MQKTIFPSVKFEYNQTDKFDYMTIYSMVRKKHTDGKYYLSLFLRAIKGKAGSITTENINQKINQFTIDIYQYQLFGDIDLLAEDYYGNKVFIIDSNQDEETERIQNIYYNHASRNTSI